MIVACPNCQSKFSLPDDKIGASGAKLRCGKCRHVFHVDPPGAPEVPDAGGLADFDFPDDLAPTPPGRQERPAAPPAADAAKAAMPDDDVPPDLFHSETYEGKDDDAGDEVDDGPVKPGFSLDDVANMSLPGSSVSKERRKRITIILGAVLLIVAATIAAVYFLNLWPGKKAAKDAAQPPAAAAPATPGQPAAEKAAPEKPAAEKPAPAADAAKKPEETAKVKDIMLQNVRQYYVSNEKAGQLFVIEGKAVNNFKTPKEMIKIEATLFDEKGGSLATQEELAGNTVSLFQLQVMTRDELKNALTSQVGVLTNNTNIAPGGETPFMVVFFDPPETVKEFGVKVVDAKDPPRQ